MSGETSSGANAPPAPSETPPKPTPLTPLGTNPRPRKWGAPSDEKDWVKVRELVGKSFHLARISEATITPEKGASAGKARPSFVLETTEGWLFSVNVTDSIGGELKGMGLPPTGADHVYTVVAQPSTISRTGDALLLREV